jgi:beta-mannosidase
LPPESIYLYCELKRGEETLGSNVLHFAPLKRVELFEPEIQAEVIGRDAQTFVSLRASRFAKDVYLSAAGIKGRFEDNFLDLVPGVTRLVGFVSDAPVTPDELRQNLKVISLKDTY